MCAQRGGRRNGAKPQQGRPGTSLAATVAGAQPTVAGVQPTVAGEQVAGVQPEGRIDGLPAG